MRKGYTILEMIGMLAFLVLVFALAFKPTRTLISDVPRQNRDFQTAASMNHLFDSLKNDIEAAKEIRIADEPNALLIDNSIIYHFDNGQVLRTVADDPNTTGLWILPHGHLVWKVKNKNALVITGWLERILLGNTETQFHNSHIFYAKGLKSGDNP